MNLLKSETVTTSQRKDWKKYEREEIAIARKLGKVDGYACCEYPFHKPWLLVSLGAYALEHPLANLYDPDHIHGKSHEFLHHDYIWIPCRICHGFCTNGFKHPNLGDLSNIEFRFMGLDQLKKLYEQGKRESFRFEKALDKIIRMIRPERIKILTGSNNDLV